MREKIVEVFFDANQMIHIPYAMNREQTERFVFEQMADHLIANDVVPVVRCKGCECFEKMTSNNSYFCNVYGGYVKEEDYCSRAQPKRERKDNG